jgi:hypothetical protein
MFAKLEWRQLNGIASVSRRRRFGGIDREGVAALKLSFAVVWAIAASNGAE